jgi:hypothetical protein
MGAVTQAVGGRPSLAGLVRRLAEGSGTTPWDGLSLKELVLQASTTPADTKLPSNK